MVECGICTWPTDPASGSCQWRGMTVHTACHDSIMQSLEDFVPIQIKDHHEYDPKHVPVTYSWCGVTFQQYDYNWYQMPDDKREELYDRYVGALNKSLDYQSDIVRAYCRRNGLGEPRFIREMKQEKMSMTELLRLIKSQDMKPGDHVVIALLPRSQHHKHMSAQLVINIARLLARRGVTFHSAHTGMDWSKPIHQHIFRTALRIQLWQDSIYKPDIETGTDGRIFRLEGRDWNETRYDHAFQWIIRHIRDKKMSPRELYVASYRFYGVYAKVSIKRSRCVFISKSRKLARARAGESHFYCNSHKIITTVKTCPVCGRNSRPVGVKVARGVTLCLVQGKLVEVADFAKAWAFYLQHNPGQDKKPWARRSRFVPEHFPLKSGD